MVCRTSFLTEEVTEASTQKLIISFCWDGELEIYLLTGNSEGDSINFNCLIILLSTTLLGRDISRLSGYGFLSSG